MPDHDSGPSSTSDERYWYNLKTGQVEFGRLTAALFRVGPFESREEAERALETLRERSRAWAEEDDSNE